ADADADDDAGGDGDADADADADDDAGGDGDADADADADDDAGGDGDADADADVAPPPRHTGFSLTAGGGRAASPNYQMTLSIGAPQPMGAAESGSHRARVGPGAVVNR
ncbi:MAG: hypothetical protein QME96_17750, partial [Myxococcota bacterium]|nr:hypothetical protein [Myxococcota bacterium]